MGVTADDEWDTESIEHWQQPIFGRQPSEQLVFVARRRMTEQHLAQPDNLGSTRHRPSGQQPLEGRVGLLCLPANDGLGIGWDGAIPSRLRSDNLGERGHFAIRQDVVSTAGHANPAK